MALITGFNKYVYFLTLLYISMDCTCENKIKIEKLINVLKVEIIAEGLSNFVSHIRKGDFYTAMVVHIVLPTAKDNANLFQLMDKSLQKISSSCTVITNDSFCCDNLDEWNIPYEKAVEIHYVPDVYIIPIYQNKSLRYFKAQLQKMDRHDAFNPRAYFILVQLTNHCGELEQGSNQSINIFNELWSMNIFHVTMLILSECDLEQTIVTARPFSPENICRTVQKNGLKYFHLFPDSREINIDLLQDDSKDLHGCDFWAGTIPFPPYVVGKPVKIENESHFEYIGGSELELLHLYSTLMNFTLKFYKTYSYELDAWFKRLPNGTVIGILQDAINHNIDIVFAGVIPSYVSYYKFDYSTSYKFSSVTWYVTDAKVAPQWMIFFRAFSFEVWVLSGFVFIMISILYHIMDNIYSFIINNKSCLICHFKRIPFANIFVIGLGLVSPLKPKISYLRVLFFSWAEYSVHWYIAYTSILFTLITNPPLEKEITTIQDLKDAGLKVSVDAVYLDIFGHVEIDGIAKSVLDNSFQCNNRELCVNQFLQERNFSVMERVESVEYLVNLKRSKIHKLSDNMFFYSISILTNKGNPLSRALDKIVLKTIQSGLLQKWEKDVGWQYHNLKSVDIQSEDESLPLSIQNLKGAFFILITGLVIASVVCLGEILINSDKLLKYKKEIRKRHF